MARSSTSFKPGQSGNPAGKPIGTKNRKTLIREKIEQFGPELMEIITKAARGEGELPPDMTAALALLARLDAPLRPRAETVEFALDTTLTRVQQADQIMAAIAAGDLDPETGNALIASLHKISDLQAADELEARLAALEAKQI